MFRYLYRQLSPAGPKARLNVFIYHRVLPVPDPMRPWEPDSVEFERQMSFVGKAFRVLPLEEAIDRLRRGCLPAAAASITFDDGYADNLTHAVPILKRHGMAATFFVAAGFLDGGRMWNDTIIESVRIARGPWLDLEDIAVGRYPLGSASERLSAGEAIINALKYQPLAQRAEKVAEIARHVGLPEASELMMTTEQLRQLHQQGMAVGGHTVNHPILARIPLDEARSEIAEGRRMLGDILRSPVHLFAYPNGKPGRDYGAEHVDMVRDSGFCAAVSTAPGFAMRDSDPFQVPRFTPWDRGRLRYGLRLARNLVQRRSEVDFGVRRQL